MATVTECIVAPGVSARFLQNDGVCRLFGLCDPTLFGGDLKLPIPAELRSRAFVDSDQAVEFVREFYRSR